MEIRKLDLPDFPASHALGAEAFGPAPAGTPPYVAPTELPVGRHTWGAFDDGRLVAKVVAVELASWFGGSRVPTCGIADVAVAPEHRAGGLLRRVFAPLLEEAAGRGEVLSTLYPTASGIYRPLGYELITTHEVVEVPTAHLARLRAPVGTTTRRATAADVPALKAVYDTWAAAQNGPVTRTGPDFAATDDELVAGFTAVTLAVDADEHGHERVVGFASWNRSGGFGPDGKVDVWDLLAVTPDGYRALWTVLGSFSSVTSAIRVRTSGADPARLVLPTAAWTSDPATLHPYMLRVSDVAGAFTAVSPGVPGLTGEVPFSVSGDPFAAADGHYLLTLGAGTARVATAGGPTYTTQGIALAFAGAQSSANLRLLGHLTGPDTHDAVLDAVLGGRPLHVRDYF